MSDPAIESLVRSIHARVEDNDLPGLEALLRRDAGQTCEALRAHAEDRWGRPVPLFSRVCTLGSNHPGGADPDALEALIRWLLEQGVDPGFTAPADAPPLIAVISNRLFRPEQRAALVRALLARGADAERGHEPPLVCRHYTPLSAAIAWRAWECAEIFLERGAGETSVLTGLLAAIEASPQAPEDEREARWYPMIRRLLPLIQDITAMPFRHPPALHTAAVLGGIQVLRWVVDRSPTVELPLAEGASLDMVGGREILEEGVTPLALVESRLQALELRLGFGEHVRYLHEARGLLLGRGATSTMAPLRRTALPGESPREVELTEQHAELSRLVAALADMRGKRLKVHLMGMPEGDVTPGIQRIGGAPLGVPLSHWPRCREHAGEDDERMAHLLSLDTSKLESPFPEGARAISVFVPTPDDLGDEPARLLAVPESFLDVEPAPPPPDLPGARRSITLAAFDVLPAIDVPFAAFLDLSNGHAGYEESWEEETEALSGLGEDEARRYLLDDSPLRDFNKAIGPRERLSEERFLALEEIASLLGSEPYIGGAPIWIQGHLHDRDFASVERIASAFFMQIGEQIGSINCGDAGTLYIGEDWSSWDCH